MLVKVRLDRNIEINPGVPSFLLNAINVNFREIAEPFPVEFVWLRLA